MNEQLKNRIILTGDIQRDIISSLSMAGAWLSQWLHHRIRGWSLHVPCNPHTVSAVSVNHRAVTGQSGLEGILTAEAVERNIHANQKEEHRNLLPFLLNKKKFKKGVRNTNSCDGKHRDLLQQHKVRSHVNQAGTQPMLCVLGLALCTWPGLSIYHGYEMSCSPCRAVRAILSPVTWMNTQDLGLNENQISVVSVLPSQLQEFKVYLPSWKPGFVCPFFVCPLQSLQVQNWCSVQPSLHPSSFEPDRINEPPSKAQS